MIPAHVLFISPAFFGYEEDIRCAFQKLGSKVDYFDERPSNSSVTKALLRLSVSFLAYRVRSYFEAIYQSISRQKYDLVLIIKGEVVPSWFLRKLREAQPEARFIFYSFDAIRNSSNCLKLFPYFDRLYSFDFDDVQNYPQLELKHLFYANEYVPGPPLELRRYDVSFIGTLHSRRYSVVQRAFKGFANTYRFFYVQAPWFYYLKRLTTGEFRHVARADVSFKKLQRAEVAKMFGESRAVLDVQRDGQTGLTMRTFEVLASGATLITSNSFIKQTDLYDPQRVIVLPPSGPEDGVEFADRVSSLSGDGRRPIGFEKHSLESWVRDLIEDQCLCPLVGDV